MSHTPHYTYTALVQRVVDGDTIVCCVDVGFSITITEKFRFAKVNAPETSTEEGQQVKGIVKDKLEGKEITLICEGKDKYGRWLATIILDGVEVNQWLLDNKYALTYEESLKLREK